MDEVKKSKVYTVSYSGWTPEQILEKAEELDATVIDVRIKPASRMPQWRKGALQAIMGSRYRHVADLGNVNYRGGPTMLQDFTSGAKALDESLAQGPVMLMCVCRDFANCHRKTIVEKLFKSGRDIEHEEIPPPGGQKPKQSYAPQQRLPL